ncbi:MAG: phage tail fiber protein [Methylobacter sp.]
MSAKSDYFENKLSDVLWRGQSLTIGSATLSWSEAPTYFLGLLKVAGSDSSAGTEISGGSYARQPLAASLANISGTQSAGSTTASSGTDGTVENNNVLTFADMPDTTGANALVEFGIYDAVTGGNLLERAVLNGGTPVQASAGATLTFAAGTLTLQEDN